LQQAVVNLPEAAVGRLVLHLLGEEAVVDFAAKIHERPLLLVVGRPRLARQAHLIVSTVNGYVRFDDEEGEEGSGRLTVISFRKRVWWRNLRDGRPFSLRLRGRDVPATAEVVEDDGRVEEGLAHLLAVAPHYGQYMFVTMEEEGRPKPDELAQAAAKRVIVYLYPADDS